jgi:hypothetical protein
VAHPQKGCPKNSEDKKFLQINERGESDGIDYKNPEGYSDVVPYQALSNLERRQRQYRPIVYICSPYSGDVEGNVAKARRFCRFAVDKGVIPIAPHLLFPQFMEEETERDLAIFMDIAILSKCKELWVFGDATAGMKAEIAYAEKKDMTIKYFSNDMEEG